MNAPNPSLSQLKIDKSSPVAPKRQGRKWLWRGGIVAGVILAGLAVWRFAPGGVRVESALVVKAYPTQAMTRLTASGYVVAQRRAAVASKLTGRLVWLGVEEGSRVREGEILARLESEDLRAALERSTAQMRAASREIEAARSEMIDADLEFGRRAKLYRQEVIARAELDTSANRQRTASARLAAAKAQFDSAVAAEKEARVNLDYADIRAPFDAVVLTKNADVGDIIAPLGAATTARAAVVTIADMGSLRVEVDVSESNIGKISVGQPAEIRLDALPDVRFPAEAHMIVPTADRAKAAVQVKVKFLKTDPRVLPEMSAKVAFLERPPTANDLAPRTAVNPRAVVEKDGKKLVFVATKDKDAESATPREVVTGAAIGDVIEIVSGLEPGEKVALSPPPELVSGRAGKVTWEK